MYQTPMAEAGRNNDDRSRLNMNWLARYRCRKHDDPYSDARSVILVVSTLIAAVTFQAGVNPPGGVWQENSDGHIAGRAIYASHKIPFYTFIIFNTLALSSSIFAIISLTFMFPFSIEIWIATLSMIITYGASIFAIIPHDDYKFRYILTTAASPVVVRVAVEGCRYVKRRLFPEFHVRMLLGCSD